jgi:hypothetical protein
MVNVIEGAINTITAVPKTIWNVVSWPFKAAGGAIGGLFEWAPTGSLIGAIGGGIMGFIKGQQGSAAGEAVNPLASAVGGAAMGALGGATVAMGAGALAGGIGGAVQGGGDVVGGLAQTVGNVSPNIPPMPNGSGKKQVG